MKSKLMFLVVPLIVVGVLFGISEEEKKTRVLESIDGCVFMTVMGEQSSKDDAQYKTDENVMLSVRDGLSWLATAQLPNGGYGAGSHQAQHVKDPHAVPADPATTAMVAMAILRSGNTFEKGVHSGELRKALNYLLETIENTDKKAPYITEVRGTQIQTKLGQNIDAVLAAQFLSTVIDRDPKNIDLKRIHRCLDICVAKITDGTDADGKQQGAGWAGVLQSSLATSALESAQAVGVELEEVVIERSRAYQKSNFDADSGGVKTADGAGVMLYAVSGSVRGSAKEARKAVEAIDKAKEKGLLEDDAEINAYNLQKAGLDDAKALEYTTAYKVYNAAKNTAQQEEVLSGFGNNGGEEFLSFLQTGESMVVNKDEDWKKWYDDMSGRILKIQNGDGSWNGHHCITSPVFCTATSLLLLTVENDIEFLRKVGS